MSLLIETMHRYRRRYALELKKTTEAHNALAGDEMRLKKILDNLFAYVALLDTSGIVLEVNKAPLERAGYRREDVVGLFFYDAPWWSYDSKVQLQLIDAIDAARRGQTLRYDAVVKMGGDLVPIDFKISPVCDDSGQIIGLLPTGVDISERKQVENKLRESERQARSALALLQKSETRFRELFENSPVAYQALDEKGRCLDVNDRSCLMLGYGREELLKLSFCDLLPDPAGLARAGFLSGLLCDGAISKELELKCKNGSLITVLLSGAVQRDAGGDFVRTHCTLHDITERKNAEEALRIAAATFETHEAILVTDSEGNILRVNRAFQKITGYASHEVLGKNPRILSSERHDEAFYAEMWRSLLNKGAWAGEVWDRRKSGEIYPKWMTITAVKDAQGKTTEYVAIFSDITERKQNEEEIRNLAFYDALTMLPNRRLLLDRFHRALSVSERSKQYGAVLFLDMDKFKLLNDTLGHNYGDLMLVEVAERIKPCVRDVDTVARIGGDEFVVLVEKISLSPVYASQKVAWIAEKIRSTLAVPYRIGQHVHHSSPSIGVCLFCGKRVAVDDLLKHADFAMYQAKNAGRNTVRFYDPVLQRAVEERAMLERDLRCSIADGQLHLYYQLQLDKNLMPLGAEALIRWMHPVRGMMSPAQFIPVAEESLLILDIGRWVINSACRQLAEWGRNIKMQNLLLAVNVSTHQFRMPDFVGSIQSAIQEHRIDPSRLKLELTEGVILDDISDVVAKMQALKALGIGLSLDDFGTGYSSLSCLKRLPIDQIKIDRSFVRDVVSNPDDAVMVKTIIDMATNFRLNVIAEGVETEAQLAFLKESGCMAFQGYYIGKPAPIDDFVVGLGNTDRILH
ncbi:EAL domain-containing protein [Candidatus Methylospira mobilis]|uniref:EAL domain-containing protein n=1 Tax=Candidatus Methylospira mobilis TaxID=1808979 RepID=A0A5Q0BJ82_9GAMM|nr:bifunctional diguanylate cyclase/phosphodiesterase [Candidatus Methylospira mobilis]QFY43619.1 EAL domain-containing protein [Candidatus Methylospira mobilis]